MTTDNIHNGVLMIRKFVNSFLKIIMNTNLILQYANSVFYCHVCW